jgi:hypothetical protein
MSVYVGPEATSAANPRERAFGTVDLIDDALAVLDESRVGPLLFMIPVWATRRTNGARWTLVPSR